MNIMKSFSETEKFKTKYDPSILLVISSVIRDQADRPKVRLCSVQFVISVLTSRVKTAASSH